MLSIEIGKSYRETRIIPRPKNAAAVKVIEELILGGGEIFQRTRVLVQDEAKLALAKVVLPRQQGIQTHKGMLSAERNLVELAGTRFKRLALMRTPEPS